MALLSCKSLALSVCLAIAAGGVSVGQAAAQTNPLSFKDQTITMVIGYAAAGGTDASGRLFAPYLAANLPGNPAIVVRNMPGAEGVTALNYFVQQTKPDGLTLTMGSGSQVDPIHYRKGTAVYDLTQFQFIGGAGRGGTFVVINKSAIPRIHDRAGPPVMMGSLDATRSGMLMVLWGTEYLGWNTKWIVGYRSTNDLMLALERGEVDMTGTANLFQIQHLIDSGKFAIFVQSGSLENGQYLPRSEFGDAPVFFNQMGGKIESPLAQAAFAYWNSFRQVDKWLALAPGTAPGIVAAYRNAFNKAIADPEFTVKSKKISEDFAPISPDDMANLIITLARTPDEAIDFIKELQRKQGVRVE